MNDSISHGPLCVARQGCKYIHNSNSEDEIMSHEINKNHLSKSSNITQISSRIVNLTTSTQETNANLVKLRIRTLHCGDILLTGAESFKFYKDVKISICKNCPLCPEDLILVCNGRQLRDDESVNNILYQFCDHKKLFVLVKTSSKTMVTINFKGDHLNDTLNPSLLVPINSRIFNFRRQLYSKKVTPLKTGAQRIIIGSRVLDDNYLLGDYLLKCKQSHHITAFILRQENLRHEVDVIAPLTNKNTMKFSLEISLPISSIREILWRLYHIPKEVELMLSLKQLNGGSYVDLNPAYTLLDYGVTTSFKSVEMSISRLENLSMSIIPNLTSSSSSSNSSNQAQTQMQMQAQSQAAFLLAAAAAAATQGMSNGGMFGGGRTSSEGAEEDLFSAMIGTSSSSSTGSAITATAAASSSTVNNSCRVEGITSNATTNANVNKSNSNGGGSKKRSNAESRGSGSSSSSSLFGGLKKGFLVANKPAAKKANSSNNTTSTSTTAASNSSNSNDQNSNSK